MARGAIPNSDRNSRTQARQDQRQLQHSRPDTGAGLMLLDEVERSHQRRKHRATRRRPSVIHPLQDRVNSPPHCAKNSLSPFCGSLSATGATTPSRTSETCTTGSPRISAKPRSSSISIPCAPASILSMCWKKRWSRVRAASQTCTHAALNSRRVPAVLSPVPHTARPAPHAATA